MFGKIRKFFEETRLEFRHVNWPSRNEAARLTMVVVILSLCLAAFLGAFDYLFTYLLKIFVVRT